MNKINCFVPFSGAAQAEKTVKGLQETGLVNNIYLLALPDVTENLSETGIAHVNFSGYIFRCNFCFIIFSDKMFSCIYLIKHIHIYK